MSCYILVSEPGRCPPWRPPSWSGLTSQSWNTPWCIPWSLRGIRQAFVMRVRVGSRDSMPCLLSTDTLDAVNPPLSERSVGQHILRVSPRLIYFEPAGQPTPAERSQILQVMEECSRAAPLPVLVMSAARTPGRWDPALRREVTAWAKQRRFSGVVLYGADLVRQTLGRMLAAGVSVMRGERITLHFAPNKTEALRIAEQIQAGIRHPATDSSPAS